MDSRRRFSTRVEDYINYRPGYPSELTLELENRIGLNPSWVVADVGSGTGISTKLFLEYGCITRAIEPNEEMRNASDQFLGHFQNYCSGQGDAEHTGLKDNSVDMVLAAQAFHWFDRQKTRKEFNRILKDEGWVALVWNNRDNSYDSMQAYEDLLLQHSTDYVNIRHTNLTEEMFQEFFGGPYAMFELPYKQVFDLKGFIGRYDSCSYAIPKNDDRYAAALSALENVFATYQEGEMFHAMYTTRAYIGQL